MAQLVFYDRVKETTQTTGTGTLTMLGAATNYQGFSVVGNANQTYYCIEDNVNNAWEIGIGTYTLSGDALSRTTILASSNSGSAVNLSAGTKNVYLPVAAQIANAINQFTSFSTSGFSWVNQGTATSSVNGDFLTMTVPQIATTDNLKYLVVNAPATPYNITAYVKVNSPCVNYNHAGIVSYDSVSGKGAFITYGTASFGKIGYASSPSSWSTLSSAAVYYGNQGWLQIHNDGTNLTFNMSVDGTNWLQMYTSTIAAISSGFTPNQAGFAVECDNATYGVVATLCSFFVG